MLTAFPDRAKFRVSSPLAAELLQAAESLPRYDNKEFYSFDLQTSVHRRIRQACPDGFDWVVDQIRSRVQQRPYSALCQGLRFDEGNKLFVAINRAFGELVARPYEAPRAQLVHYIQPATDRPAAAGTHFESEKLHTDTADWETPVQWISMVCVRADCEGGGRSRILDFETLRDQAAARLEPDMLTLLESVPVPWLLAADRGGGVKWRPVLTSSGICWRRYTINLALESANLGISDKMFAALDAFENVVNSAHGTVEFLMREGELLFVDNHRTIHARTPIASGVASDRLMIRSWIRDKVS